MDIMITGARGFIGRALCSRLAFDNKVVGVDITAPPDGALNIVWERADLTDSDSVAAVCEYYSPDVVVHCAGVAHQKIGTVDFASYMRVNSEATENLAKVAAKYNSDVSFIFLSSVSVYGEGPHTRGIRSAVTSEFHEAGINPQITQNEKDTSCKGTKALTKNKNGVGVGEDADCNPSSDYAYSKLDAEKRLISLCKRGILRNLIILRLAPVYDREWSLNLDRRVFAPKKMAYFKFGKGRQKMSALARPNLVEFIEFLLKRPSQTTGVEIMDVCDTEPYEFNKIIQVFKRSNIHPKRPVVTIPLPIVWLATRIAGFLLPNKRKWLHSGYEKLASSLVFDNSKMLKTGFIPRHTLHTIFSHNE